MQYYIDAIILVRCHTIIEADSQSEAELKALERALSCTAREENDFVIDDQDEPVKMGSAQLVKE